MEFQMFIKNIIECIYYGSATIALVIGGLWAFRHFRHERPFEPNLTLNISASAWEIGQTKLLIHVELTYVNTGKSRIIIGKSMKKPREDKNRTFFKIFAMKPDITSLSDKPDLFDWQNQTWAEVIYDDWFPDTPDIFQEPGETEVATLDLILSNNIKLINTWVKIWEDKKNPFFWSTSRVFSIDDLLKQSACGLNNRPSS